MKINTYFLSVVTPRTTALNNKLAYTRSLYFPWTLEGISSPELGKRGSSDGDGGGRGLLSLTSSAVWRSIGCVVSPVSV